MKTMIALLLTLSSGTALANGARSAPTDLKLEQLMECTRDLVERGVVNFDNAERAGTYLDQFATDRNGAVNACEHHLANGRTSGSTTRAKLAFTIGQSTQISQAAKAILLGFLVPSAKCSSIGVTASAGVWVFALGAKVDAAKCLGSNGRRWLEVSPGVAWTPGIGAVASANWGGYEREAQSTYGVGVELDGSSWMNYAALVGEHKGFSTNFDQEKNGVTSLGYTAGLGAFIGGGPQLNIAFLPMGTSKIALVEIYRTQYPTVKLQLN